MIDTVIQAIVATWDIDGLPIYKGFPTQDVAYPFVSFNITPANVSRTFCSDIMAFTVIITVWTKDESSANVQTYLNSIKSLYNRGTISNILYSKLMGEIVIKDIDSNFYNGSSTFLMAIEQSV